MTVENIAPDSSPVALLLLDVINDLEFDDGEMLREHFEPIAGCIADLAAGARAEGVPVIYVNDNYGRWRSDFRSLVAHCLEDGVRGGAIARILQPQSQDYFVLKPKHSGFYATSLEVLLQHLGARTLILAGVAANICVLFTAADAHMRGYRLVVPVDCVASNTRTETAAAVSLMATTLDADTRPSSEIDLAELRRDVNVGGDRQ